MNLHLLLNPVVRKKRETARQPRVSRTCTKSYNVLEDKKALEPTISAPIEEDIANGNDDECYLCEGIEKLCSLL